jgi:hypothetical protein
VYQAEEKSSPLFRTWIKVKCKHRTGVVLRAAGLLLQAGEQTVSLLLQVIDQIRPTVSNLVQKKNQFGGVLLQPHKEATRSSSVLY